MARKPVVFPGDRFGRLVVVELTAVSATKGRRTYLCRCDCGREVEVPTSRLRSGTTRSCGCLHIERSTKHGQCLSGAWRSWRAMRDRCHNPNHFAFHHYGGRGITHDPRWDDFAAFLEDMGERPEGLTLDRIDPDGNYCKANCRWATRYQQTHNRRKPQ